MKITKKQEKENFINEYLKENLYAYEPSPSIKLKNYHIRMAKRQYNKKLLEETSERYYDVTFRTPFGATTTYKLMGKNGQHAFSKYNYTDVQGRRMKFISATLSRNQKDKYKDGGNINDRGNFSEYSNDALADMIVNLSRYENTEDNIRIVQEELKNRKNRKQGTTYSVSKRGNEYVYKIKGENFGGYELTHVSKHKLSDSEINEIGRSNEYKNGGVMNDGKNINFEYTIGGL